MSEGKYLISNGHEDSETTYKLYDMYNNGNAFTRGVVAVDVTEKTSFTGSFSNENQQEGEVFSYYSSLYDKSSSIGYIDGSWSNNVLNLTIGMDGVVNGVLNSCDITGTVAIPDADKNLYNFDYTLSNCANSGEYEGFGMISLLDGDPYFTVISGNDNRMEFFLVSSLTLLLLFFLFQAISQVLVIDLQDLE